MSLTIEMLDSALKVMVQAWTELQEDKDGIWSLIDEYRELRYKMIDRETETCCFFKVVSNGELERRMEEIDTQGRALFPKTREIDSENIPEILKKATRDNRYYLMYVPRHWELENAYWIYRIVTRLSPNPYLGGLPIK